MTASRWESQVTMGTASLFVRREPWDCEQLGLEAGKVERFAFDSGTDAAAAVALALSVAQQHGLRHLAARVSTSDRTALMALQASGFRLVDTVVHLEAALTESPPSEPAPNGIALEWATAADEAALAALSASAFADPASCFNRDLNDGGFTDAQVRRVYATWARTSVGGPAADRTLVARTGERVVGFLSLKDPDADRVARVPLNAVSTSERGRGVYGALVRAAFEAMRAKGATKLEVTTQLQQLAVQRTWLRLGARQSGSSYSLHRWLSGP
jgi:hypothetical protein